MPDIRTFLDLSTAHLPEDVCDRLGAHPGVIAHETVYGWLMWVPEDPADPAERGGAPIPEVVLTIQRYTRAAGCDYVLLPPGTGNHPGPHPETVGGQRREHHHPRLPDPDRTTARLRAHRRA